MDLKTGDRVIMNNKYTVSDKNKNKIWTVRSEPWKCCETMVVILKRKKGWYPVDGLDKAC